MADQNTVPHNIIDGVVVYNRPCDTCKRRKIKCDNRQPCFQCLPRGIKCEYTTQFSHSRKLAELKNQQKKSEQNKSEEEKSTRSDSTSSANGITSETNSSQYTPEITCSSKFPPLSNPVCTTSTGFKFCPNVTAAVVLFNEAFQHIMKLVMPNNTEEYGIEFSTLLWHRLFTTVVPDDLIRTSTTISLETITQLMHHGSIFSIGAKINDVNDRANHFHRAAATILDLPIIEKSKRDPETAKKIILSSIYCMFYRMLNKDFSTILPLWTRASKLFLENELTFEPDAFEEILCWMIILEPSESCSNSLVWIQKLEAIQNSNNKYEVRLFQSIARMLAYLSRLSKLPPYDTQSLTEIWNYATDAEIILLGSAGSARSHFYGVLIYGLKAIAAINMTYNMEDEVDRCIQCVEELYWQITDLRERMWLRSQFEYLQFVFEKRQHDTSDMNTYELTIGMLENLIEMISNSPVLPVQADLIVNSQ